MGNKLVTFGKLGASLRARLSRPAKATEGRHRPRRPLRVIRVLDASHTPFGTGRIFMSGRMADVCAELDRLAALEAAAGWGSSEH